MLLKLISLLVEWYAFHRALKPPNETQSKTLKTEGLFASSFVKTSNFFGTASCVFIFGYYGWIMLQQQLGAMRAAGTAPLADWTFVDILSLVLFVIGGTLRVWSFKTLGQHFTFDVRILNKHRLIQTGPYAFVRHPSYTAASMVMLGCQLLYMRLIFVEGLPAFSRAFFLLLAMTVLPAAVFFQWKRVGHEEKTLKAHFGEEWDEYARVRKRFIPYIV